ncbi:MAG TPA: N-acetyl sugar amidotransferase [Gemmatimonadaceae bacterium]|nr:N-acetyl sugar amidotransferase [Gemmatimonadaceae bacterium]
MAVRPYRTCSRCIMDTVADRSVTFDADGLCHHCVRYDALLPSRVVPGEAGRRELARLVATIKEEGKGKEYDCIIGVSGGVDSTYVAYLVKQHGLRPLAVHLDNGWNSELAVKNISRVLRKLDIDLFTTVLDWEEFRDLQISFLKASTPDGEIPTDHAIVATLWGEAVRRGIRYFISGMNFATESIGVPDWTYGHSDWRYIKDVHRQFGNTKLRTFPHITLPYLALYVNGIRRIRTVSILNYVDYRKAEVMDFLQKELGWEYYGGKHHESIYTRFYQGYVLPKKFGVDKRYGHLSDLVKAGQLTREQALEEIKRPPYPEAVQQEDIVYVCKKLGLSRSEFDLIMESPVRSFRDYRNWYSVWQGMRHSVNWLRGRGLYPR